MESVKIALNESLNNPNDRSNEFIITRPLNYHNNVSKDKGFSKRTTIFTDTLNYWIKAAEDKLPIAKQFIIEVINVLIVFDDVLDLSILRRGSPAAYTIHGIPATVNGCFYSLFNMYDKLFDECKTNKARKDLIDAITEGCIGQGTEVYWRDNFICPSEVEYLMMIKRKTGGFMKIISTILYIFSNKNIDTRRYCALTGMFHQILDENQNLCSERSFKSKGFCEDLEEGKFSIHVIHAIKNKKHEKEILQILKERPKDVEMKKRFLALLEKSGSFEYANLLLNCLKDEIKQEGKKLGPNPFFENAVNFSYF